MIRKYKAADLEAVMTNWYNAQSIAHPFLSEQFIEKVKIMMKDIFIPNSKTWVYEKEGELIGFIAMMNNEIGGLFVNPAYQTQGVGTCLLNYISKNHNSIEVEVFAKNKIGLPFYYKNGFTIIEKYLHSETQEIVIRMQKRVI
jgi:putative acetyltransferase